MGLSDRHYQQVSPLGTAVKMSVLDRTSSFASMVVARSGQGQQPSNEPAPGKRASWIRQADDEGRLTIVDQPLPIVRERVDADRAWGTCAISVQCVR